MKGFVAWERIEKVPGQRDWTDLDKLAPFLARTDLKVLLRVDRAPGWSHPSNPDPLAPPDPAFYPEWSDFLRDLAARGRGRIAAYEVWNEPNLTVEWGGRPADPEQYVKLLDAGYRGIKRGDRSALVVGFSLAPTSGTESGAMDTLVFAERAYAAGAGAFFDVYGAHPYGFGQPPDVAGRFTHRSVEFERAIMERWGDGAKPVWATEWGWLMEPSANCLSRPEWRAASYVEESSAAQYMADAIAFEREHYPWLTAVFVFNLDFSTAPWYTEPCEPMLWHSLLNPDGTPRATYEALRRR
jgi:hypothetical protein